MEYTAAILIPLITAIGQAIKKTGIDVKFMPVISMAIGVGLAFLIGIGATVAITIITGVGIGLASCGLYDVVHKKKEAPIGK